MGFHKTEGFHEETVKTKHSISIDVWPPWKPMDHSLSIEKPLKRSHGISIRFGHHGKPIVHGFSLGKALKSHDSWRSINQLKHRGFF